MNEQKGRRRRLADVTGSKWLRKRREEEITK